MGKIFMDCEVGDGRLIWVEQIIGSSPWLRGGKPMTTQLETFVSLWEMDINVFWMLLRILFRQFRPL